LNKSWIRVTGGILAIIGGIINFGLAILFFLGIVPPVFIRLAKKSLNPKQDGQSTRILESS
jgi:hypothetical protein